MSALTEQVAREHRPYRDPVAPGRLWLCECDGGNVSRDIVAHVYHVAAATEQAVCAAREGRRGVPTSLDSPRDCPHQWEAVSMAMETQLLDERGRVRVRQPDLDRGKVYYICRRCASHTYMTTQWVGWRMYGSEDADLPRRGPNRPEWSLEEDDGSNV